MEVKVELGIASFCAVVLVAGCRVRGAAQAHDGCGRAMATELGCEEPSLSSLPRRVQRQNAVAHRGRFPAPVIHLHRWFAERF